MSKVCERCSKEHDGSYGSGRFCSQSCANKKPHTEKSKQKMKDSLKLDDGETKCNTKTIGNISELHIITKFVEMGFNVSIPYGDNAKYDIVVDINNILYKIQIKTGNLKDGIIIFPTTNCNSHTKEKIKYNKTCDYIAIYVRILKTIYLIKPEDVSSIGYLRIEPVKNNQVKGIKFAEDYLFEKVIKTIK